MIAVTNALAGDARAIWGIGRELSREQWNHGAKIDYRYSTPQPHDKISTRHTQK